jgi:hypothetical protein
MRPRDVRRLDQGGEPQPDLQPDGATGALSSDAGIDLYWLPLGAGGHSVRWNGRIYEAVVSRLERRSAAPLFHSALVVRLPPDRYVVEMTPVWGTPGADRGVVAEGAVGSRLLGRLRLFRYEVRCWPGGTIGDVGEAVDSPQRLTTDPARCRSLLARLRGVPTPVWGRDELDAGEMWNSNSVTSWALVRAGLDLQGVRPPAAGRAPGWDAGLVVARRGVGGPPDVIPGTSTPAGTRTGRPGRRRR